MEIYLPYDFDYKIKLEYKDSLTSKNFLLKYDSFIKEVLKR